MVIYARGLLHLHAAACIAASGALVPWSISDDAPVVAEGDAADASPSAPSSRRGPVVSMLRFYSATISQADGARCAMYPTCAGYARDAVRKHGPLLGGFMAADRLLHEGGVTDHWYEQVTPHGVHRWYDPVEQNDFWFTDDDDDDRDE